MKRPRFNRMAVASSRGVSVQKSHADYLKECHERNKEFIAELQISIKIQPKYYVRYFGQLKEISPVEAASIDAKLIVTL